MIFNIILIIFLLAMIYWWAMQGLFSALLHLAMVITAGALALALWEPLTHGLLLGFKPPVAWGLGLIVPFAALLIGLRYASDKLVPDNLHFTHLVDMLGGGAAGLASGVLTAGIGVIGIGFLPMGPSIAGYQPYSLGTYGQVEASDAGLWVPVEYWTTDFYELLAGSPGWFGGAFTTGDPLAHRQPNLAKQQALIRLRPDTFSAVAATPESVSLGSLYRQPWSEVGDPAKTAFNKTAVPFDTEASDKLLIIETEWNQTSGVYDTDSQLRVPPTHIRLITENEDGGIEVVGPAAYVRPDPTKDGQRFFHPFEETDTVAFGRTPSETLAWGFLVDQDKTLKHLLVRNLRFTLPDADAHETDPEAVRKAMGKLPPEPKEDEESEDQSDDDQQQTTGDDEYPSPEGIDWIDATSDLPGRALNRNQVSNAPEHAITGGRQSVGAGSYVQQNLRVDRIKNANLRLELSGDRRDSFLGKIIQQASQIEMPKFIDTAGNSYFPHGFVVEHDDGSRIIAVKGSNAPFKQANELPENIPDDSKVYLYYSVPVGISLESVQYQGSKVKPLDEWTVPERVNSYTYDD